MRTTELPARQCSLLLFVATPTEEDSLANAARAKGLTFDLIKDPLLGEYVWMGSVGNETVIAIRPVRESGRLVMGSLGRLGSAARAIRFREATGASGIVQLGTAFGIEPTIQRIGDVLISSSLIPYDLRDVLPAREPNEPYRVEYSRATRQPARTALVSLFAREQSRGGRRFGVYVGAMLSGAARIHSQRFRDELVAGVPGGDDPMVGGEMEGVGLLAASTSSDDPVWCVAKGISDFADEDRDRVIAEGRVLAASNAADFVLSALANETLKR
jgi:nucleoside phosphorylase